MAIARLIPCNHPNTVISHGSHVCSSCGLVLERVIANPLVFISDPRAHEKVKASTLHFGAPLNRVHPHVSFQRIPGVHNQFANKNARSKIRPYLYTTSKMATLQFNASWVKIYHVLEILSRITKQTTRYFRVGAIIGAIYYSAIERGNIVNVKDIFHYFKLRGHGCTRRGLFHACAFIKNHDWENFGSNAHLHQDRIISGFCKKHNVPVPVVKDATRFAERFGTGHSSRVLAAAGLYLAAMKHGIYFVQVQLAEEFGITAGTIRNVVRKLRTQCGAPRISRKGRNTYYLLGGE